MVLTLVLFGAVFSSIFWVIYALRFIAASLSGISFFDAGIVNVLLYALFVCLPILIIWGIFGFISQYAYSRSVNKQLFKLFSQMKKNQEYSDLLARIMLETEQNIKNSFMLGRFDLMIADMNELLSEFLQRERLVSAEQIETLWAKVQNGGKWSFGKVVIENYNQQPLFQKRIFNDAQDDALLSGTVMEFCARYQTLLGLLEKHDKERVLLGIVETGVLGKVFAILAPVADQIRKTREAFAIAEPRPTTTELQPEDHRPTKESVYGLTDNNVLPTREPTENKVQRIWEKFIPKKKTEAAPSAPQKDPLSLALERSFGHEEPVKEEPVFEKREQERPLETVAEAKTVEESVALPDNDSPVLDTQKTLDTLRKEWQELNPTPKEVEQSKGEDEKITFPFSGWTDAENYQK